MAATHWKVRPYVITGGRTRPLEPLLLHTLVSARYDPLFAAGLPPESRTLYEHAQTTCSVAELSASCEMPLGVTRVLLADLACAGRLAVHGAMSPSEDLDLLERIRDGLRELA